jgi:acyl carrier protein
VVIDEACQSNGSSERALRACIQGVASEKNPIIILLSTFHLPTGLFQEYWDQADEKGFKRYRWDCFDTLQKCTRGMETATPEDPYAKKFCKGCFLTYPHKIVNEVGAMVSGKMAGCQGKARLSEGWATFESIVEARKNNIGTNIFEVEFANERPNYAGSIYDAELVDFARVPAEALGNFTAAAVGIDWGIETENSLCVTLGLRKLEYIYLAEAVYWDHKLVSDVAVLLNTWRNALKINFPVLADSSHPFNNTELTQAGFDVRPVVFGTWKKVGIQNVSKYFVISRIKINAELTRMVEQLKEYRKNETSGAIVKKNDHGPDSLMSMLLNFRFEDEFGPDIEKAAVLEEQNRMMITDNVKPPFSFKADGLSAPGVMKPIAPRDDQKGRSVLVF